MQSCRSAASKVRPRACPHLVTSRAHSHVLTLCALSHRPCSLAVTGLAFSRGGEGLVQLDLNDADATKTLLAELEPDVVVHCAAERKPDVCERTPDKARNLNVVATSNLAELASTLKFTLIYISTDYVFPGNAAPQGYDVDDAPAPTNLYGETKYDGEKAVLGAKGAKASVLRVPVLCGPAESNSESAVNCLYDVVVKAALKEKAAKMDDWAARYPTNTLDIARVIADLSGEPAKGSLIHTVNRIWLTLGRAVQNSRSSNRSHRFCTFLLKND